MISHMINFFKEEERRIIYQDKIVVRNKNTKIYSIIVVLINTYACV